MLTINLGVFMCGSSRENSHSEWTLPCTRCARWALPGIGPWQGHPRWDSGRTMRPADGARAAPRNEGSINHWRSLGILRYHHLELSTDIISFLCSSFWVYHWILSVNSKVSSLGNHWMKLWIFWELRSQWWWIFVVNESKRLATKHRLVICFRKIVGSFLSLEDLSSLLGYALQQRVSFE